MVRFTASYARYPYGRTARLDGVLREAGIDEGLIAQIMAGGEAVKKTDKQAVKVAWLRGAMQRMDALLDHDTRVRVRAMSACCLEGERGKLARKLARENETLAERIAAANAAHFLFGHSVTEQLDGSLLVLFQPEGQPAYRCSCLGEVSEPLSLTYCMCCGGHVRHHLQTVLGCELACEVLSSALASAGRQPCSFVLTYAQETL
ncbi:MAG: hypothetical protein LLG44_14695 [Chloroflexi bacterium]|nr:hypothetical protein [Chloroflexota bacterium]